VGLVVSIVTARAEVHRRRGRGGENAETTDPYLPVSGAFAEVVPLRVQVDACLGGGPTRLPESLWTIMQPALIHRPWRAPLMGCIRLLRRRRVGRMPPMITRHNPTQLHNPPGYHHVTVIEAGRLAFLAGQCPLDAFGALVGAGDIDLQIDQVAANAATVLAAVGARPDQVVRSVVYVVSDDNSVLAAAWHQLTLSVIGSAFTTASTLLGVTRLGFSGQLVEVDLTAAL
jgi:enamine deaminase RidA (YjgF/YER057c/UK114 family)